MNLMSLLLMTGLHVAQPTPEAAKSVFDFYYGGQGKGFVIAEAFLCAEVAEKSKDNKYDCTQRVEGNLKKGASVNVYLVLLVPEGDKKELMIQSTLDGVVRETKDVAVEGKGMRTRIWKTFTASKAGKWEWKVMDGANVLSTITATAE